MCLEAEEIDPPARGDIERQAVDVGKHHAALLDETGDSLAYRRRKG